MARADRKYSTFKLLRPSGEWDTLRVPRMFGADEVAGHARHSVVVLHVPRGCNAIVANQSGLTRGPCDVVWNAKAGAFMAAYPDTTRVSHRELYSHAF